MTPSFSISSISSIKCFCNAGESGYCLTRNGLSSVRVISCSINEVRPSFALDRVKNKSTFFFRRLCCKGESSSELCSEFMPFVQPAVACQDKFSNDNCKLTALQKSMPKINACLTVGITRHFKGISVLLKTTGKHTTPIFLWGVPSAVVTFKLSELENSFSLNFSIRYRPLAPRIFKLEPVSSRQVSLTVCIKIFKYGRSSEAI